MFTPTYDEEYTAILENVRASKLRKAGLVGAYAAAKSDLGDEVTASVTSGHGVFLHGTCGTGKTYAAAQAVRESLKAGTAKLITAAHLLANIRAEFDGNGTGALDRAKSYDVLAIDDIGAEKVTEWSMETLTDIIDYRTASGKVTIFTSNYRLGKLRDMWGGVNGDRLASRIFGACDIIEVKGEDRRFHG